LQRRPCSKIDELGAVEHRELRSARSGETFSLSALLSDLVGFKGVFVHHEII
jgi:hypothetical protein